FGPRNGGGGDSGLDHPRPAAPEADDDHRETAEAGATAAGDPHRPTLLPPIDHFLRRQAAGE
ncbi:MAG: hypothetical protein D6739_05275, partial [Nitrospirae bacterium]